MIQRGQKSKILLKMADFGHFPSDWGARRANTPMPSLMPPLIRVKMKRKGILS